jgi:hypothetical protein
MGGSELGPAFREGEELLAAIADWLVETGYPFDWTHTENPIPVEMRWALVEAWCRAEDDPDGFTSWRRACAEEGGW